MLRVTTRQLADGALALSMQGHALGPVNGQGHDLVCAAASILCLTLAQLARDYCPRPQIHLAVGEAHLQGMAEPGRAADFQTAWQGVCRGFELLAAQYPQCLEVALWR